MDTDTVYVSAKDLGKSIGLSTYQVHRLLILMGYLTETYVTIMTTPPQYASLFVPTKLGMKASQVSGERWPVLRWDVELVGALLCRVNGSLSQRPHVL